MNLVRLGMILTLGAVAAYAIAVYAGLPSEVVSVGGNQITKSVNVVVDCPILDNRTSGVGMIWVALTAIMAATVVAAIDLKRRVY